MWHNGRISQNVVQTGQTLQVTCNVLLHSTLDSKSLLHHQLQQTATKLKAVMTDNQV